MLESWRDRSERRAESSLTSMVAEFACACSCDICGIGRLCRRAALKPRTSTRRSRAAACERRGDPRCIWSGGHQFLLRNRQPIRAAQNHLAGSRRARDCRAACREVERREVPVVLGPPASPHPRPRVPARSAMARSWFLTRSSGRPAGCAWRNSASRAFALAQFGCQALGFGSGELDRTLGFFLGLSRTRGDEQRREFSSRPPAPFPDRSP